MKWMKPAARARSAPPAYLPTQSASDIARHCQLLETRPASNEIRLAITPARTGWHLDIAARDRPGLLASVTGVLAARNISVVQAVVATWADGGALEAFVIDDAITDAGALQAALEADLEQPLASEPVPDAVVVFDNDAGPWFTRMEVFAPDRTGLLHGVATAIAVGGADVHGAGVATRDGVAVDQFDLTDQAGAKVSPERQAAIRSRTLSGVRNYSARRSRFRNLFV
jgi:[protein-PII] uridylyltransferase